jgi:hypothetical protein
MIHSPEDFKQGTPKSLKEALVNGLMKVPASLWTDVSANRELIASIIKIEAADFLAQVWTEYNLKNVEQNEMLMALWRDVNEGVRK